MIKLKDLIKEEHCECGGGCSTKEQVKEEVITEKKLNFLEMI